MPTFIKTGLWETITTTKAPKGWLNLTKLIKDNSGGTTGNYIPLTGTEEGKPVSSIIETESITGLSSIQSDLIIGINDISKDLEDLGKSSTITFGSNSTSRTTTISNTFNEYNIGLSTIVNENGETEIKISNSYNLLAKGFTSDIDHSDIDTTNKLIYAQRQYVDNKVAEVLTETNVAQFMDGGLVTKLTPSGNDTLLARDLLTNEAVEVTISSIAENPEFLINCLNSATPTQLSTIKSILGIV